MRANAPGFTSKVDDAAAADELSSSLLLLLLLLPLVGTVDGLYAMLDMADDTLDAGEYEIGDSARPPPPPLPAVVPLDSGCATALRTC